MNDELRDKITEVLVSFAGSDLNEQAQAIIDSLNLVTYEGETHTHVAGKWEKK